MSSESETNADTIEEKRRKNVLDNQQFLQSLKLLNVRDDLKSTVSAVTNGNKPPRKKPKRKEIIDESEMRRSSRIQLLPRSNYNDESILDDNNYVLSPDKTSDDEEDDLASAFTAKIDKDWQPVHSDKSSTKNKRPIRKAAKKVPGGVKIFLPNIGLQASTVTSKDKSHKSHVSKKMNVAISSSSEED